MPSSRAENSKRTVAQDEPVRALLERARAAAAGVLASGVVHEFANLLTVVDGMRQMGALAPDAAPKLSLLDQPADRCGAVVEAYRHVFSDPALGPTSFSARVELDCLADLLRAHLRSCSARIEIADAETDGVVEASVGVLLRPAFLCVLLGRLERARAGGFVPRRLELAARGDAEGAAFSGRIVAESSPRPGARRPSGSRPFAEGVEALGTELIRAASGRVDEAPSAGGANGDGEPSFRVWMPA